VPYVPANVTLRPDARIIYIDIDPVKQNMPTWGFPADFLVQCDSSKTIPVLTKLIREKLSRERQHELQVRRRQFRDDHQRQRDEWLKRAESQATQKPISREWVCRCIAEAIDDDTIVLEEPIFPDSPVLRLIPRTRPGTLFHGGTSLGWALGASLGAKLACPDKLVVSLLGDGCFVFGCPTATLWAAGAYHAPFLSVIFNNEQYNSPRKAIRRAYGPDSYSEKTGFWPGTDIKPTPEYALIARACHSYGQVVSEPSDLPSALKNAIEQVNHGTAAVLDVRIGTTF
jgi:acetolactate synthase-1/2/3 large subunit